MPDKHGDLLDPFDDCESPPARELFHKLGFDPLPPDQLDDFQLRGRLWEFIYALAGRRFHLGRTDHLSDRELYTWLHDQWLNGLVEDIPFEAEWNCHIEVLDLNSGNERDEQTWLRFFASEEEREEWLLLHPNRSLPARDRPPYDRDRWLPEPPGVPAPADDELPWFEEEDDEDEGDEDDPLGLQRVDAEIHAQKRMEEAMAKDPAQLEEWQRPVDQLQKVGVSLLPPDELTEETLTAKLWELLHNLACRGFYVLHTDHLSDLEVYTGLWEQGLRDEALLPGKCRSGGWFHDFIGGGSEEDIQTALRHYHTDEDRADYARDWPDEPLPPKENPPFHRDWRLPKGPF